MSVTIPSGAAQWVPGQYRFEFGLWYAEGGSRKTLAIDPVYFEVRFVAKGSGDEINLLSNALMQEVPGLSQTLLGDTRYARMGLAESILVLDAHDVFARYALIRKALLVDAKPDVAVTLWGAIQQDIMDGSAHRADILVNPLHSLRPVFVTKETLEKVVAAGLKEAQDARMLPAAGKKQVDNLVEKRDFGAVIGLMTTSDKATLASAEDAWSALWAIRAIGKAKIAMAHETLVKELAKLPPIPGLWQREIVDALASIHDDARHGNLRGHSWGEGTAVIKWWIAHPTLETLH